VGKSAVWSGGWVAREMISYSTHSTSSVFLITITCFIQATMSSSAHVVGSRPSGIDVSYEDDVVSEQEEETIIDVTPVSAVLAQVSLLLQQL
jgi:hypothetical protein